MLGEAGEVAPCGDGGFDFDVEVVLKGVVFSRTKPKMGRLEVLCSGRVGAIVCVLGRGVFRCCAWSRIGCLRIL
eukprot:scaffold1877_cov140-Isochrysis_galbana.AAC.4